MTRHYWMDGRLHRIDENPASILTHGLHYGTGVFEGIRAYDTPDGPAVFRLDAHLDRMQRGADALGLAMDRDGLFRGTLETLRKNGDKAAYIRPIAWFSGPGLALDVAPLKGHSAVATLPWTSHLGDAAVSKGIGLKTSSFRKNSHKAIPALKLTGAYVNGILAKKEATEAGFDEALFIDDQGFVCECTGENVFAWLGDALVAVDHPDALPGITRDTLITLTGATSRALRREELDAADEIFVCGTSAEVTPITRLDGRSLPIGPRTRALAARYQDVVHGRAEKGRGWLTPVATLPTGDDAWQGLLAAAGGY